MTVEGVHSHNVGDGKASLGIFRACRAMPRCQPEGPHGPSEIVDPGDFAWTDGGVGLGVREARRSRTERLSGVSSSCCSHSASASSRRGRARRNEGVGRQDELGCEPDLRGLRRHPDETPATLAFEGQRIFGAQRQHSVPRLCRSDQGQRAILAEKYAP
jgi:hypothetical protein